MSDRFGTDRLGPFERPPERIVSLVPSMTSSMVDLGLGEKLIGITDFCPQPQPEGPHLPCVGGTRNPSIEDIIALQPDLVLANREENDRGTVEQLIDRGAAVWLTFPCTVDAAIEDLWKLIRLIPTEAQNTAKLLTLERSLDWMRHSLRGQPVMRVFYPIWMDADEQGVWLMTVNAETYAHDVLAACGGENVFAARERRYPLAADLGRCEPEDPGDRDRRYPRVTLDEVRSQSPELILLPDEPFDFTDQHVTQMLEVFADTPAARSGNIYRIDGRLVNWHGTMLAQALVELPDYFTAT